MVGERIKTGALVGGGVSIIVGSGLGGSADGATTGALLPCGTVGWFGAGVGPTVKTDIDMD